MRQDSQSWYWDSAGILKTLSWIHNSKQPTRSFGTKCSVFGALFYFRYVFMAKDQHNQLTTVSLESWQSLHIQTEMEKLSADSKTIPCKVLRETLIAIQAIKWVESSTHYERSVFPLVFCAWEVCLPSSSGHCQGWLGLAGSLDWH